MAQNTPQKRKSKKAGNSLLLLDFEVETMKALSTGPASTPSLNLGIQWCSLRGVETGLAVAEVAKACPVLPSPYQVCLH